MSTVKQISKEMAIKHVLISYLSEQENLRHIFTYIKFNIYRFVMMV
jgi:hypothetical protein